MHLIRSMEGICSRASDPSRWEVFLMLAQESVGSHG